MTDLKTPEEERALAAFRKMDLRRKREVLSFMEGTAQRFPIRVPPSLSVVANFEEPKETNRRRKAPTLTLVQAV